MDTCTFSIRSVQSHDPPVPLASLAALAAAILAFLLVLPSRGAPPSDAPACEVDAPAEHPPLAPLGQRPAILRGRSSRRFPVARRRPHGGSGGPPGEPPQGPPRPPLPSTLPPPGEPPSTGEPPQGPPGEPPGTPPDEPTAAGDEPPPDVRSVVALASHFPQLLRWLRTLNIPERDRQDVGQEVLIGAFHRWASIVAPPGVSEATARRNWLFGVAVNKASEYRRHRGPKADRLTDPLEHAIRIPSGAPTAEELLLRREEAAEIAEEVDLERLRAAVAPEAWSAFVAYEVEGLSMKAIAAAHGVPVGTIATRIRTAKADIRAAILRARAQRATDAQRRRIRPKGGK